MLDGHRIGGLLLLGGVGKRFGSETPKQFHRLAGKCVFLHTLEAFLSARIFDEIVLSCHPEWIDVVQNMLPASTLPIQIVNAGATRQESSLRGLRGFQMPPDVVVIHDAVRPFVSNDLLLQNARTALQTGAVDTCIPSTDTLVHSLDRHSIAMIPKRSEYLRGQTPQSFNYSLILDAHRQTKRQDCSDDCQLILDQGHSVSIVMGNETNLKITSELDLFLAEQILRLHLQERKVASSGSLSPQRYAIVGGTGGIGQAINRKITNLGGVAIPLSRQTSPRLDLRDGASIREAFREIGPLDGLINCAGHLFVQPLARLSIEEIDEAINVNLKGLILCCQMADLKTGAHVINIASSSFSRGRKNMSIYSSAKAGVVNFTQGWAEERPDLRIHAVIPQRTNTSMRRQNFPGEDVQTLLDPDVVADTVVDLLQEPDLTNLLVEVRKK